MKCCICILTLGASLAAAAPPDTHEAAHEELRFGKKLEIGLGIGIDYAQYGYYVPTRFINDDPLAIKVDPDSMVRYGTGYTLKLNVVSPITYYWIAGFFTQLDPNTQIRHTREPEPPNADTYRSQTTVTPIPRMVIGYVFPLTHTFYLSLAAGFYTEPYRRFSAAGSQVESLPVNFFNRYGLILNPTLKILLADYTFLNASLSLEKDIQDWYYERYSAMVAGKTAFEIHFTLGLSVFFNPFGS